MICSNKMKYIQEILNETIDLRKKSKDNILKMLEDKGYDIIDDDNEYKYLLKMTMDSVSEENVEKIKKDFEDKQNKFTELQNITPENMWLNELEILEIEYNKFIINHKKSIENEINTKTKKKK